MTDQPLNNMNKEISSKYEQSGSLGVGQMSDGVIKDNAKVAGKIDEINANTVHKTEIKAENIYINNSSSDSSQEKTKKNEKSKIAFAIAGTLNDIDRTKLNVIVALLKKMSGDAELEIIDLDEGSIKIILEGSEEGLQKIKELFESGELEEIEGFPIEYVRDLTEAENKKVEIKSELIKKILNQTINKNLERAELRGANLEGAYLERANLSGAELRGANLRGAFLRGAELRGANLRGAYLERANLSGAELRGANLRGAYLERANLSGANLRGAFLERANLSGANLEGAELRGAELRGAYLIGANLEGAELRGAELRGAILIGANLEGAELRGAELRGAILIMAILIGADFREAQLEKARFSNNQGISELRKQDFISRGAIFVEDPNSGDRSKSFAPVK